MKNKKFKFFVMICWIVAGMTACGSDESSDGVACPEIAVNGLEVTLYDSETLEPLSETDCGISHVNGHDLQWLTYDEANQYYYGIYNAGSYELWTWCDEYISQDFAVEIVDDGAACPQPVLQQVSVYLESAIGTSESYRTCMEENANLTLYGILDLIIAVRSDAALEAFLNDYNIIDAETFELTDSQLHLIKHAVEDGSQTEWVCRYEEDERVEWADLAFPGIYSNYFSQQACEAAGGEWTSFSDGCVDSCFSQTEESAMCTQAFEYGCECGVDRCWDFETESCMSPEEYEG